MKKPTSTKLESMTTFYISDKKIEIITFCRVENTLFFTSESLIFLSEIAIHSLTFTHAALFGVLLHAAFLQSLALE